MAQPEPVPTTASPNQLFLTLFLMFAFLLTFLFSVRWGSYRYDGLIVAGFNLFGILTVLLFIYLVWKAVRAGPHPGGFCVSAATLAGRTLLMGFEMLLAFIVVVATNPNPVAGFLIFGVVGFATGLLMGSPHMKPRELGGLAFAIGYVGTFGGVLASIPFVTMEVRPVFSGLDLMPLVALSGLVALPVGGACALGSLVSGSLRRPRPLATATA
jgi:hypothetical protein